MITCRTVAFADPAFAHCAQIRRVVFIDEQRVPEEEEMDDLDPTAIHALADLDGQPVGTGRLLLQDEGETRIGRMAVVRERRGTGVGSAILRHLMEEARARARSRVILAGQLHAIPFYERHGFTTWGDIFLDAGIEHRWMAREL